MGAGNPISDVGDLLYGEHVFQCDGGMQFNKWPTVLPARAIVQIIPRNYIREMM